MSKSTEEDSYEELQDDSSSANTVDTIDDDVSYEIQTEDELLTDESNSEMTQEDYFGSTSSEEKEESEAAWVDSEDDEDLRDDLDNDAVWLNTEGAMKRIKKATRKISFKYSRRVFTAKCRVKLFKAFPGIKVLVDTFNLVYLIKNFDDFKTFKIDFFKITDMCFFNGKILFSSNTSSLIRQMDLNGKVLDLKKGTGNVKKMLVSGDKLYILGDKLFVFNQNLSLVSEFSCVFSDIAVSQESVLCLKEDGDLYLFNRDLEFQDKIVFPFKFQFKKVYFAQDKFIICTEDGLLILDSAFKEIKSTRNIKEPVSSLVFNSDFIVHGSMCANSLRIMRADLTYFEKFPFSRIKINPISTMEIEGNVVYFSDSRFISSLELKYV